MTIEHTTTNIYKADGWQVVVFYDGKIYRPFFFSHHWSVFSTPRK